jgi:hypothetical protein
LQLYDLAIKRDGANFLSWVFKRYISAQPGKMVIIVDGESGRGEVESVSMDEKMDEKKKVNSLVTLRS